MRAPRRAKRGGLVARRGSPFSPEDLDDDGQEAVG